MSTRRRPRLTIVCEPCGGYRLEKLMPEHGDAKLTELLATLADCPKARAAGSYDRCKAVYEGFAAR